MNTFNIKGLHRSHTCLDRITVAYPYQAQVMWPTFNLMILDPWQNNHDKNKASSSQSTKNNYFVSFSMVMRIITHFYNLKIEKFEFWKLILLIYFQIMRWNIMEHPWRQKMTFEETIQNMTMISPKEISHNRINGLRYIVSSIFILVWSLFGHSCQKFIWPDQFGFDNFIKLPWADLTLVWKIVVIMSLFRYQFVLRFFNDWWNSILRSKKKVL